MEQVGRSPSISYHVLKDWKLTEAVVSKTVLDLREPVALLLSCPSRAWSDCSCKRDWKEAFSALKELCKELALDHKISLSDLSGQSALQAKKKAVEILRTNRQIFACLDHNRYTPCFEVGNGGHLRAKEFPASTLEESHSWPEMRKLLELGKGRVFVPAMACETLRSDILEGLVEKGWIPFIGRGGGRNALQGFIWCNGFLLTIKEYFSKGQERPLIRDVLHSTGYIYDKFYGYWTGIRRGSRCGLILVSGNRFFRPGTPPQHPRLTPLSEAAERIIQCSSPSKQDFATLVNSGILPLLGEAKYELEWTSRGPHIRLFEDEPLYIDVPPRIQRVLWPILRGNLVVWVATWSDCLLAKQEFTKLRESGDQERMILYLEEGKQRELKEMAGDLPQTPVLEMRSAAELKKPPVAFVDWPPTVEREQGLVPVKKSSPVALLCQLANRRWITVLH